MAVRAALLRQLVGLQLGLAVDDKVQGPVGLATISPGEWASMKFHASAWSSVGTIVARSKAWISGWGQLQHFLPPFYVAQGGRTGTGSQDQRMNDVHRVCCLLLGNGIESIKQCPV